MKNAAGVELNPRGGDTVGLPQSADTWPPQPGLLFGTKVSIMEALVGVLQAHGRLEPTYGRRILGHGPAAQVMPGEGQIIVSLVAVLPGLAGQQQFQFPSGDYGAVASSGRRFARYRALVIRPWTSLNMSGWAPGLPMPETMAQQSLDLDTDGEICWAALTSFGLGGVTTSIPKAPIKQDNTLVASMNAWGPEGQCAGWEYIVEQQL